MSSNKYIKKPIPIEAIQWTGNNFDQLWRLAGDKVWIDESGYINSAVILLVIVLNILLAYSSS